MSDDKADRLDWLDATGKELVGAYARQSKVAVVIRDTEDNGMRVIAPDMPREQLVNYLRLAADAMGRNSDTRRPQ